jgi:hypothetical protein
MIYATHLVDSFKWKKLIKNFYDQIKPYLLPKVTLVIIYDFRQWLDRLKLKP